MENISATTEFITNYAEILTVNYTGYGNVTDTVNFTETSDVIVARLDDVTTIIASLWITIAVIGFLGNALLFVMTHNQSIRDQSYALFLCVLSIVDSIVLFVRLTHGSALLASTQAKPQGPLVGILDTNVSCVLTGLELCARCLSAWILAALAVDRAICLKYPMQRLTVCSRQRAILTTAVIVLIVILLYLPTILVGMVTKYQQDYVIYSASFCESLYKWFYKKLEPMDPILSHVLPLVSEIVCCFVLTVTLVSRTKKLHVIALTDRLTAERIQNYNSIAGTFLLLFLLHIFSSLPLGMYSMIAVPLDARIRWRKVDAHSRYNVIQEVLQTTGLLHHACKLYVLVGLSSFFRRLLYHVTCPNRVNVEANLRANTAKRQQACDRFDAFAQTRRRDRQILTLNLTDTSSMMKLPRMPTPHIEITPQLSNSMYQVDTLVLTPPASSPPQDSPQVDYEDQDGTTSATGTVNGQTLEAQVFDVERHLSRKRSTDSILREAVQKLNALTDNFSEKF